MTSGSQFFPWKFKENKCEICNPRANLGFCRGLVFAIIGVIFRIIITNKACSANGVLQGNASRDTLCRRAFAGRLDKKICRKICGVIKGDMEKPPHQGHAWGTCIQIATHCHCSGEWAILWFFRIECTLLYRWRTQPSWPGTASVSRGVRAIRPESSVWKRQISPSHYFQPFKSTINPDEPILFYYSFHVPVPRQFYTPERGILFHMPRRFFLDKQRQIVYPNIYTSMPSFPACS